MLEILSRLPTESALDCKLVCKPWKQIVSHPKFGQLHLDRLDDSSSVDDDSDNKVSFIYFLLNQHQQLYYVKCDEENRHEMFLTRKKKICLSPAFQTCSIVGSSNGLICFKTWGEGKNVSSYYAPTYILNPITREYLILPNREGEYKWIGFGYSASTNRYKVVRIRCTSDDPNSGIAQVYTVGSGIGWRNLGDRGLNWRKIESICPFAGVFVNGALHWVNIKDGTILAFDLTNEMFRELPAPPCAPRDGDPFSLIHLGVLGEFLSATYHFDDNSSEIWLLKKTKDNSVWSWSKQCSLNKYIHLSFKFTKSGTLVCFGHNKIYSYDPKASSAEMDMGFADVSIYDAILHKNTLVSLRALGEKDTRTMEFGENASSSEVAETSA